MKVFKFGGASVNSIERIKAVTEIIKGEKDASFLIVISAIGKTTNALEKVAELFYAGNKHEALESFQRIKTEHIITLNELIKINNKEANEHLQIFFTEIEWLLHDKPVREYNYYYDQIVCIGELLSTSIITHYLNTCEIKNVWLDVRDILRTDDNFRDANVDICYTSKMICETLLPLFKNNRIVLTQGFIGSTYENQSTTLGREGSDYTAALFANLLDAEDLTIWKDVEGIMNADPKSFPDAKYIRALNYKEVIEMSYYGAQVIHPKTIKPLQNKNIPLHVKCFLDKSLPGTLISNINTNNLPPIIVIKEHQALLKFSTLDFSFIGEKPMHILHKVFSELKINPNLSQNGAINFMICMDEQIEKIEKLAFSVSAYFDVLVETNLTLISVMHYNTETIDILIKNKELILEQKTPNMVQVLIRQAIN